MQELQPEMQKIREKYKNDPQKAQQETMAIFQKNGVNPLAGCLPMLVQMPILIAFYHAIIRTEAIKEQSFLWLTLGEKDPYYILPIVAAITTYFFSLRIVANKELNLTVKRQGQGFVIAIVG